MLLWAAALFVAAQTPPVDSYWTLTPPRPFNPTVSGSDGGLDFQTELAVSIREHSFASYTTQMALDGRARRVVAFYLVPGRTPERRFVARSVSTFGPYPLRTLWADSRTCPAMIVRLKSLDDLHIEPMAPYGLTRRKLGGGVLDGVEIQLRTMAAGPEGDVVAMQLSGNGEFLTLWADATNRALDPCLSLQQPEALPPIQDPLRYKNNGRPG